MRSTGIFAALALGGAVSAFPPSGPPKPPSPPDVNPFVGRKLYVNKAYSTQLDATHDVFVSRNDTLNAKKTLAAQEAGTFVWLPTIQGLGALDDVIAAARKAQHETRKKQIVGLVLYDLPDRDCSAGESAGELSGEAGLARYKTEYVDVWESKLRRAKDLTFAIVVEPDSIGNMVTNQGVELCATAKPIQEEGIAYAIKKLQLPNVNLYLDASHGGWLGWADNLPLAASQFATILSKAGSKSKVRGFSTNVSNYNPFQATVRENYTEWSPSWDEDHYTQSLAPFLEEEGLPARFIIDQARVHLPGARKEWGEWCNVSPAKFGKSEETETGNSYVDALVWIKPPGESDGQCGMAGAPRAGTWFNDYAVMLVENASDDFLPEL